MTKHFCDRCRAELPDTDVLTVLTVMQAPGTLRLQFVTLDTRVSQWCKVCAESFHRWLTAPR